MVAGSVVLGVGALLGLAAPRAGLSIGDGVWRQVANGAVSLSMVAGFNLLSHRMARTRWGVAGAHEADFRRSPRVLSVAVAAAAGVASYVVALLLLLSLGLMDGDDRALYPSAVVAAFVGSVVVTRAGEPLWRRWTTTSRLRP